MKPPPPSTACPCCDGLSRREFLRTAAAGVAVAAAGALPLGSRAEAVPAARRVGQSETLVATLYKSLTPEQRQAVTFPFDHPLRSKVDNNWLITDQRVGEFYTADQQAMIREIFLGLHSPAYAQRVMQQVEHDAGRRGFGGCAIALFGEPGTGRFEFVLTGRHVTRRCDGDSVAGAAFGGPIFYGHAAQGFYEKADHPGNIYWYQAKRANEVYQMLDGQQRQQALLAEQPAERGTDTVKLPGARGGLPGIAVRDLSRDQKDEVRKVLADLLAPFRRADADEALKLIEANGFDNLAMAFYKSNDIGHDGVWDVWQLEGPAMVWYFRGAPHVHTWVNVRARV